MIYVKSVFAGVTALVLCAIILLLVSSISVKRDAPPNVAVAIDVVSWAKQASTQSRYQLLALLVFGAGFYWEFQRASK